MPKVRRERTKYHDKAPPVFEEAAEYDQDEDGQEQTAEAELSSLSRGQQRRKKQRDAFMRKFDFVNFVREQEDAKRSGSLADMTGLVDELHKVAKNSIDTAGDVTAPVRRPHGRRAKAAEDEREISKYQNVLAFEAFQKDPLGSLEQHLRNSMAQQQSGEAIGATAGKKHKKGAAR